MRQELGRSEDTVSGDGASGDKRNGRLLLFWRGARRNGPTWDSLADPPRAAKRSVVPALRPALSSRGKRWPLLVLAILVALITAVVAYALMDANRPAMRAVLTHIAG